MIFLSLFLSFLPTIVYSQTHVQGDVQGVWTSENSPYIAEDNLDVPNHQQLIIESGVEVLFPENYEFQVHGRIEIRGTEEDSVTVRPEEIEGRWGGLRIIDADSVCVINYCYLTDGFCNENDSPNDPLNSRGNIYTWESTVQISNCSIMNGDVLEVVSQFI